MVVQSWAAPAAAAPILPSGTRKAPLSVPWPRRLSRDFSSETHETS
jgi:hypothetical protein